MNKFSMWRWAVRTRQYATPFGGAYNRGQKLEEQSTSPCNTIPFSSLSSGSNPFAKSAKHAYAEAPREAIIGFESGDQPRCVMTTAPSREPNLGPPAPAKSHQFSEGEIRFAIIGGKIAVSRAVATYIDFGIHVVVGAILFLIIFVVAAALSLTVATFGSYGLAPAWLVKGTGYIEVGTWVADAAVYILLVVTQALRVARTLWDFRGD